MSRAKSITIVQPCPFCGSPSVRVEEIDDGIVCAVVCRACDANGPHVWRNGPKRGFGKAAMRAAVQRWNARTEGTVMPRGSTDDDGDAGNAGHIKLSCTEFPYNC